MLGGTSRKKAQLSGMQKAAALLLFMGKDTATKLADSFSPDEIEGFVKTAASIKSLEAEAVDELVEEFRANFIKMGMLAEADKASDFFKELVKKEDEGDGEEDGDGENGAAGPDLGDTPDREEIANFLNTESDYMCIFLLSTLGDELLATIFSELEPERRKALFKLYLDREPSDPKIEIMMRDELFESMKVVEEDDGSQQRIEAVASVMNYLPEDTGEELMDFIRSGDPNAAAILKQSLFRFTEIVDLPIEARRLIFDGVEPDSIVQALQNVEDPLKESVLDVLSQRNRRMIESELSRGGVPEETSMAAQRQIASLVLRLAKDGAIVLEAPADAAEDDAA
ncbi:MAG: FliG C-terminal domain-containing protein [Pseudomonadota bacterium]